MDAVGSNIRVDARGREVLRILPRNNDAVNEEWISDKTRFVADGLKVQRLDRPYVRKDGRLEPAGWDEALALVGARLKAAKPSRIAALAGDLAGAEEMFALKDLLARLGCRNIDCRQDGAKLDPKLGRASYLFNSGIEGIEQADAILLVGSNPRLEAALINTRIRKRWRQAGVAVGLIGQQADLTYPYEYLGGGPQTLAEVLDGKHSFAGVLKAAARPMVVVGAAAAARADGLAVLSAAARTALAAAEGKEPGWNPFNVLHCAAGRVAGLDLGFVPDSGSLDLTGLDVAYLLGADEIDMKRLGNAFVVYQGSHGDAGAERADVVLPGAAYTEKSATYVNTEGRPQTTARAAFPPGDAKEDWAIIRALSGQLGHRLPYDALPALRAAMYKQVPALARLDAVAAADIKGVETLAAGGGKLGTEPFGVAVADFYLTNPIARASAVMAELSAFKQAAGQRTTERTTGTHG
jgi:NADH-quinone oxidoreductase subunit G